jgi:phage shock protein B
MASVTAILLALIVVLGPTWLVFNFLGQAVRAKGLNKRDAETLQQVAAIAARMEARMTAVECILDNETPSWRQNSAPIRRAG